MITLLLILVIIDFFFITVLVEKEDPSPFWSFFLILVPIACYHYFYKAIDFNSTWLFIKTQLPSILGYTLLYIFIGVLWSFWRWFVFLKKNKRYQDQEFIKEYKRYEKELETYNRFQEAPTNETGLITKYNGKKYDKPVEPVIKYNIPEATYHKGKITTWTIYWIFSIVGYVLSDFYNFVYNKISGGYDQISANVFKNN